MTSAEPHIASDNATAAVQPLPLPFELIALTCRYVEAAHELCPFIAVRPPAVPISEMSENLSTAPTHAQDLQKLKQINQYLHHLEGLIPPDAEATLERRKAMTDLGDLRAAYNRYIAAAIACLRKALKLPEVISRTSLELRVKTMLAELLINETRETAQAESLILSSLLSAAKHETFTEHRFKLAHLQIQMAINQNNHKFARTLVRRAIADLNALRSDASVWQYRFLLLDLHLCISDDSDCAAALVIAQNIGAVAQRYSHHQIQWLALLLTAKLALKAENFRLCHDALACLSQAFSNTDGLPHILQDPSNVPNLYATGISVDTCASLPRALVVQFFLLTSAYYLSMANTGAAKAALKRSHGLLDIAVENAEAGEMQGWVMLPVPAVRTSDYQQTVGVSPASVESIPQSLLVSVMPKALCYTYTYLISTAIHLDPSVETGRCLLYSAAGLDQIVLKSNSECGAWMHPGDTVRMIRTAQLHVIDMQISMLAHRASMFVMHGKLFRAQEAIDEIALLAHSSGLWQKRCAHITLLQASLHHSLLDFNTARRLYAVAAKLFQADTQLNMVCRASEIFVRLASLDDGNDAERLSIEAAARGLLLSASQHSGPAIVLLANLVEGLTSARLTQAKACFTKALTIADDLSFQHAKPLVLALLGAYFHFTEPDQAKRMMQSCSTLCRSMGGVDGRWSPGAEARPDVVGILHLGQHSGKAMLDIYSREEDNQRIKKQETYLKAHTFRLEQEQRWAAL